MLASRTRRLRLPLYAIICGIPLAVTTGIIENRPEASIIGAKYYGYPLVWRVTLTLQPTEHNFTNLAVDMAFWVAVSFLVLIIIEKIAHRRAQ